MPQTKMETQSEPNGHHIDDGRNVIPQGQGHSGSDIFFAAVEMSRMPMILTDPHQKDNPIIFCNQAFEILGFSYNFRFPLKLLISYPHEFQTLELTKVFSNGFGSLVHSKSAPLSQMNSSSQFLKHGNFWV